MATSKNNPKTKVPAKSAAKGKTKAASAKPAAAKGTPKPAPKAVKPASKSVSGQSPKPTAKVPAKPDPKAAKPDPKAAKPDPKVGSKAPAKQPPAKPAAVAPAKSSGAAKKSPDQKPSPKPSQKPSPKPSQKPLTKSAGERTKVSGKVDTPAPKSGPKAGPKVGPKPAEKSGPAKPAPAKKGPIDFSTARSVAAAAVVATPDAQGYVMINGRRVRVLSAAAVPTKRKIAAAPAAEEKPEPQISSIKTKLSAKDLEDYKQRLLQKRRQVFGMITGMEDEALRSSGGNLSNMPLHMADIGTDTYDQDFTLGMAESERGLMNEIDDALRRIEDRTYGVCQMSGQPIPKARLDAKPWAKYTVESARRIESGQAR